MRQTLIPILSIVVLLLAACNQASGDGQLPTLVALPSATTRVEAQNQAIETEEITATEELIETEEPLSTVEPEPDNTLEEPTYSLSDFDNPTLWRIVTSDIVNAYACFSVECDIRLTYENGDLIRVVDTNDGWHTVLTLQSILVYVEEEFTIFVQIIEEGFVTEEVSAPEIVATATQQTSGTGSTNPATTPITIGSNSTGNTTVINISAQSGNSNPATATATPGQSPTALPQATITANPLFTPVVNPGNDAPPGVIINPSPIAPGGNTGAAPPGFSSPTPGSQPPPNSGPTAP